MKLIPPAIARQVARQTLLAKKNSPSILFGSGVAGMVGSTVLACRATLRLEEVLIEIQRNQQQAKEIKQRVDSGLANGTTYSNIEYRRDMSIILTRGLGNVVKLYGPSVLLGAASIGCLTKSHNILQERNLAVTAAYAAVDEAFKKYRGRVVEKYGEDEDRLLRYESEEVDIIDEETGKVISTVRVNDDSPGHYARYFDEQSSSWNRQPEYNHPFLRSQQNWFNDLLHARGHVFLNEVYDALGLSHTSEGSVVGWVRKPDGSGFIDFGIWDEYEGVRDFFNGRENSILLEFNCDGLIWDQIEKNKDAKRVMEWRQ